MDTVVRGVAIYLFLLLIFRLSGKRSLAQITTFDLVLLLIISETTQQALIGNNFSLTTAFLLIITLAGVDILFSLWKQRSPRLEQILDDAPLVIVENGKLLQERMTKERIDEADILAAARELQGLERLDQIKYGVLERGGHITIVPTESARGR